MYFSEGDLSHRLYVCVALINCSVLFCDKNILPKSL